MIDTAYSIVGKLFLLPTEPTRLASVVSVPAAGAGCSGGTSPVISDTIGFNSGTSVMDGTSGPALVSSGVSPSVTSETGSSG